MIATAVYDWQTIYRPVLSQLLGFKDQGNGRGRACCPCHDGGPPAELYLSVGDQGQLFLKCYPRGSGTQPCRTEDVLARLNLRMTHLFPDWEAREEAYQKAKRERDTKPAPKPGEGKTVRPALRNPWTEKVYEYWNPDGPGGRPFLSFAVVKKRGECGGKDFPTKRPNPDFDPNKMESRDNPAWLWNLKGVTKVLYKLPELRAALKERRERYVFVPEGEKDVDTARERLGLTATTHPGGALKWTQEQYTAELAGCNVVLIADEDAVMEDPNKPGFFTCPGIDHVRDVALKLLPKAKSVRVLRLPGGRAGHDLTDWYDMRLREADAADQKVPGSGAFNGPGEIRALVEAALVVTSPDDVKKIIPRGERVWPLPPGAWPDSVPKPSPPQSGQAADKGTVTAPAPQSGQADKKADSPPMGNDGAVAALLAVVADLKRVAPAGPRSVAEFGGELWFAVAAMQTAFGTLHAGGVADYAAARRAALYVAAEIVRGLDAIPQLRGPT